MDSRSPEPTTEFVLDHRKLIIAFLLIILVCGAFFVIGFLEGKRQTVRASMEPTPPAPVSGTADAAPGPAIKNESSPAGSAQGQDKSVREQLDWYKNVQSGEGESRKSSEGDKAFPEARKPSSMRPKETRPGPPVSPGSMIPAAKITYSVQVGAFRERHEAETKIEELKAKGFQGVIEPPNPPDQLVLVKVGKFNVRAEAVAMQLQLKKAGFSCFIKTN